MEPIRSTWTAWGFIGACALPATTLDLGPDIRIERPSPERLRELSPAALRPQLPAPRWPEYFSALPAEIIVRSTRVLWLKTTAVDSSEAWVAVEEMVPAVIAALAGFGDPSPRVELVRVGRSDPSGHIPTVVTPWVGGTLGGFATRDLLPDEQEKVIRRCEVARTRAARAAHLFHAAVRQRDMADLSQRSIANCILNYFLVVEHIAQELSRQGNPTGAPEGAEKLVVELYKALSADTPLTTKLKKVRTTNDALQRLDNKFLNQRIESTGGNLSVDPSIVQDALTVAKLRNTELAHPGKKDLKESGVGVEMAERAANAFLSAYLDRP